MNVLRPRSLLRLVGLPISWLRIVIVLTSFWGALIFQQTTPKPIATANMDNLPSTQTTPQPGLPPKSAAKKSQVPKAAGDTPKPVPTVSSQPPSQTHTPQSTHTPQEAAEADILKAELEALENQLLKDREDLHRQHQQKQQAIMEKHRARLSGQDSPPFINPPSSFPSTHNTPITSPDSHLPVPTPQFATASPFRKQQQPMYATPLLLFCSFCDYWPYLPRSLCFSLSTPMAAPAPQAQSQVQAYAYPGYQGSSIAATPPIVPSSNSATIKPTPPAQATRTPLSAPLQVRCVFHVITPLFCNKLNLLFFFLTWCRAHNPRPFNFKAKSLPRFVNFIISWLLLCTFSCPIQPFFIIIISHCYICYASL